MIKSFKKSIEFLKENKLNYHSKIWENMIINNFENINIDKIENFRNNGIAQGHDNTFKYKLNKKKILTEIKLKENLILFKKYQNLLPRKNENFGNWRNFILFNNKMIDENIFDQLKFFDLINNICFNKKKNKYLLEIGSGFGWLARMILKKNKNIKYFIMDLPETNLLSEYYLSNSFKGLKIFNFEKMNSDIFKKKYIKNYDIFILPPFVKLRNINFDIIINRNSIMEMNRQELEKYFNIINNSTKPGSFFINQNRYYQDQAGFKNFFYKYPYDNRWNVVYSKQSFTSRRIHILITKRTSSFNNSLKHELAKIKIISKNHSPPNIFPIFLMNIYRKLKKIFR